MYAWIVIGRVLEIQKIWFCIFWRREKIVNFVFLHWDWINSAWYCIVCYSWNDGARLVNLFCIGWNANSFFVPSFRTMYVYTVHACVHRSMCMYDRWWWWFCKSANEEYIESNKHSKYLNVCVWRGRIFFFFHYATSNGRFMNLYFARTFSARIYFSENREREKEKKSKKKKKSQRRRGIKITTEQFLNHHSFLILI